MSKPIRPLPPLFARALRAKIDTLPEDIREAVRAHFDELLHASAEIRAYRFAQRKKRRAAAAAAQSAK